MANGDTPAGPSFRVRAVAHDGAIYVRLADLLDYVAHPNHDLDSDSRDVVQGLLTQLGEALERGD